MKKLILFALVLNITAMSVNALTYNEWLTGTAGLDENSNVTTYSMTPYWDDNILELDMPFRPFDKQVVSQNPPDFSWKYVDGAESYNIRVSSTSDMTDIVYEKNGILKNVLNPDVTFDVDTYYWQVQYVKGGTSSDWSRIRRFRISPDATEFKVDSIDTMLAKIPASHPRIYMTDEIKAEALKNTYYVNKLKDDVINTKNSSSFVSTDAELTAKVTAGGDIYSLYGNVLRVCMKAAIYYQLTGDEEIAEVAKTLLSDVCEWDYLNGNSSYKTQDQTFRETALIGAFCYDLMFDYLSDLQKEKLLDMVKKRSEILYDDLFIARPVYKFPYAGHGDAAYKYLGVVSIALYKDIPEAGNWLREILPFFINTYPAYATGEDGGSITGTGYFRYTAIYGKLLADALDILGIIDLYEKPALKNEVKYIAYMYPKGSVGAFGDQSYEIFGAYGAQALGLLYRKYQNPLTAWLYKENDATPGNGEINSMFMFLTKECDVEPPSQLPDGHLFKETGVVAMHSDLENPERISLFFRSSKLGAFNHNHPDQNSFVIQAYGEQLAIDSGYYDYYYSDFDKNYSRRTYAHNAITYNNGTGQEYRRNNDNEYNKSLKGNIEGFVTTDYFDSVTGNAKESYKGNLDKIKRSIIYLRPDIFIVVDDLKYKNDENTTFEFFLNGYEDVDLVDNNTATIKKGKAELNADVLYPSVTGYYSDKFAGPDGIEYTPTGRFADMQVHQRVWFKTPSVNNTKMVTTLKVNETGKTIPDITSQKYDNYIKLQSEDGTQVYINLTDDNITTSDGITFKGAAVTKKDNNILLTDGCYLEIDGKKIISSDSNITMFLSDDKTLISADDDVNINIDKDISSVSDKNLQYIPLNVKNNGVKLNKNGDDLRFLLDKGEYEFYFNKIPVTINDTEIAISDTKFIQEGNIMNYSLTIERQKEFSKDTDYYLYMALYEGERLVKVEKKDFTVKTNEYKKEIEETIEIPTDIENPICKAYIWQDNLSPQMTPSTFNDNSVDIRKITIDGKPLADFSNSNDVYSYSYDYYKEGSPEIKVIPENSAAKVSIKNIEKYPQTAEIKITSEDKTKERTIYINFDISVDLVTKKIYPSYYALSFGNNTYKSYAPDRWEISPVSDLATDSRFYIRKLDYASVTPYIQFDLSNEDIDFSKVKNIKLNLSMSEVYAVYEGDTYNTTDGNTAVADSSFEKVRITPRLVYESDWATAYSETISDSSYPEYTKYPVGESMTIESQTVNYKLYRSNLDMDLIKEHLIKNKELTLVLYVDSNPKMANETNAPYAGNWTYVRHSGTNRPSIEITYYDE